MKTADIEAELNTLYDELRRAYKRLFGCKKETRNIIVQQITEIKRDINRYSMILKERENNDAKRERSLQG